MEPRVEPRRSLRLLIALANLALGALLVAALVWATLKIIHAVLLFSLGILVAYALDPLVTRLRGLARNRLSRGGGVFVVLITFVGLLTLLVFLAAGPTGRQIHELGARAPELRARADALAASIDAGLAQRHIDFHVATGAQRLVRLVHDRGQALAGEALRAAGLIAEGLVNLLLVLLVAVYFLVYSPELKQRLSKHVPPLYQQHFQGLRRDMNQILGGFIRGQLLMAASMGLCVGFGCALLRLPFSILIGIFVAITSLIPVVGAYLGAIPAVLLALLDPGSPVAKLAWVVLLFFVVNEAGSKILYPRLVGNATGLHEVVVLFVLIAGAEVGGIIGALLAVPVTALVGLVAVYAYRVWKQGQYPDDPQPAPPVIQAPSTPKLPPAPLTRERAARSG